MQRPERVMVWLTENIQACLRIFWQAQHQWLVRDILHLPQGVYSVYVLHPPHDPQDRIRPIRGRIRLSRGQGFIPVLPTADTGFPQVIQNLLLSL